MIFLGAWGNVSPVMGRRGRSGVAVGDGENGGTSVIGSGDVGGVRRGVGRVGNTVKTGVARGGNGVIRSGVGLGGKGVRSGVGRGGKGVSACVSGRTGLAASMNEGKATARIVPTSSSVPPRRNQDLQRAIVCPSTGILIWLNHIPKGPKHNSRRIHDPAAVVSVDQVRGYKAGRLILPPGGQCPGV